MTDPRTPKALAWLDAHPSMPAAEAARQFGLHPSTVSHACKARAVPRCPTCGQTLPKVAA